MRRRSFIPLSFGSRTTLIVSGNFLSSFFIGGFFLSFLPEVLSVGEHRALWSRLVTVWSQFRARFSPLRMNASADCKGSYSEKTMEGASPEKAGVGGSTPSLATIIPKDLGVFAHCL